MMNLTVDKKQMLRSLFLLCFLFYAISPLTYCVPGTRAAGSGFETRKPGQSIQGPHVLLWELIVKELSALAGADQRNRAETVLISKKRALLPEDDAMRLHPFVLIVHNPAGASQVSDMAVWDMPSASPRNIRAGFHSLYAGHSPPSR
jgi:hypothetical protein